MNKKTAIFLAIAAISGLAAFYFTKKKGSLTQGNIFTGLQKPKETDSETELPPEIRNRPEFPLKLGSRGDKVRDVQKYINAGIAAQKKMPGTQPGDSMDTVSTDGIWGAQTQTALRSLNLPTSISAERYYSIKKQLQ